MKRVDFIIKVFRESLHKGQVMNEMEMSLKMLCCFKGRWLSIIVLETENLLFSLSITKTVNPNFLYFIIAETRFSQLIPNRITMNFIQIKNLIHKQEINTLLSRDRF